MSEAIKAIPATIKGIVSEVKRCLDAIQSNSMRAGQLLQAAKEMHPDGKAWLAWASAEFGLAKAQVYKLVKVFEVFGNDARFEGVAMRVLYALASQADADQIELAAKAAQEGVLDTAFVTRMLAPEAKLAPTPAPAAPEGSGNQPKPAIAGAATGADKADAAPWGDDAQGQAQAQHGEVLQLSGAVDKSVDNYESAPAPVDNSIKELVHEVRMLREQLANKDALIEQLRREKAKPVVPVLPHLMSDDPCIVLGVKPNDDKVFVGNRARDLLKMYKGNKQVCDNIAAARDMYLAG